MMKNWLDGTEIVLRPPEVVKTTAEGMNWSNTHRAEAECRSCGRRIVIEASVEGGEVQPMSTGTLPGCQHRKCGEKFPALLFAYWPLLFEVE